MTRSFSSFKPVNGNGNGNGNEARRCSGLVAVTVAVAVIERAQSSRWRASVSRFAETIDDQT